MPSAFPKSTSSNPIISRLTLVFFTAYLFIGLLTFTHYGISWDEQRSRLNGLLTYDYVFKRSPALFSDPDRDYGTALELPLVVGEKLLQLSAPQDVFFFRHLTTFLIFFTAVIVFYHLSLIVTRHSLGGLIGSLFLVLSPRIYADSFYNSKDIGLLCGVIFSLYTSIKFLNRPSTKTAIIHGLASAFAIDIRLPGLIIPIITVGFFALDSLSGATLRLKSRLILLGIYLISLAIFTFLLWPYLWANPLSRFYEAFRNMSQFPRYSAPVLYLGNYFPANQPPWHYIPVWVAFSTPLSYLSLVAISLITITIQTVKSRHRLATLYSQIRLPLLFLSTFSFPLIIVLVFRSTLYDGWRQLYFIYPPLLLFALFGFFSLKLKKYLLPLMALDLLLVISFMVRAHPLQNIYFNPLVGNLDVAKRNFDLDYWGLSFRKGLEFLSKYDATDNIPIFFAYGNAGSIDILPEPARSRFLAVSSPEDARYILSNYRWYPQDYPPHIKELYSVTLDQVKVMSVLELPLR